MHNFVEEVGYIILCGFAIYLLHTFLYLLAAVKIEYKRDPTLPWHVMRFLVRRPGHLYYAGWTLLLWVLSMHTAPDNRMRVVYIAAACVGVFATMFPYPRANRRSRF
jgi:hypothetical protein